MAKGDKGKGKDAVGALDTEIDGLFQLPAAEFTAARNALATRLKKAGRGEDGEKVKGLSRPPMTAWTVNQLYWKHRDDFERLIATGERFRVAQASQLAGKSADIRGPLEARRAALADMAKLAATVLRQGGGSATPDNMRRITTTLEALSTYGSLPDAPPAGRLTDDVQAPGFETLAALVPRVGDAIRSAGPTRVIQFQHKKPTKSKGKHTPEEDARRAAEERTAKIAAARAVLKEAERALRESRQEAQQAEERLKQAAAQAKDAEQEKVEAEQRLEQATASADAAKQQARRVAAEAEAAAGALEDAERAVETSTRELAAYESID